MVESKPVVRILGISAYYHDSAAAVLVDGDIVAAAQEERFTRCKHDSAFPKNAIEFCLKQAGICAEDIDYVVFYDKPFLKFERLLETYLSFVPRGFVSFLKALPVWLKEKLFQKRMLIKALSQIDDGVNWVEKLLFSEHHYSHAASAYYPSPFKDAVVLTMDGVGEWATTSVCVGSGERLDLVKEIHFPHSLGLLYSAFTYYLGFKVNSGEYKVMGLAPYGEPKYVDLIYEHFIDVKEDGSFRMNQDYFNYCTGLTMTNRRFDEVFGQPRRNPEGQLEPFHMDVAASLQQVIEEVVLKLCAHLAESYSSRNLCLAGGVALNCVANGKILRSGLFDNLWVQPAAGDAGGALGAALSAYYVFLGKPRTVLAEDSMKGSYLGPSFTDDEIYSRIIAAGGVAERLDENKLVSEVAKIVADGQAVGWFQGRMEYGPRALGGRSIIADPRCEGMQRTLNLKVKFRESFRPFAPSVLREHVADWFQVEGDSPYMLLVAPVSENKRKKVDEESLQLSGVDKLNVVRSDIPAVVHVDYSARVQTVDGQFNPKYRQLLSAFHELTGCPVMINTSFNIRGEPIVCTPEDAFRCFMGTDLDILAIGNCLLKKSEQDKALQKDYRQAFELD